MDERINGRTCCVNKLDRRESLDVDMRKDRLATWCFELLLIVSLYYTWYRYPFRMNSAETSGQYSDTPGWIRALKYVILLAIAIYAWINVNVSNRTMLQYSTRSSGGTLLLSCMASWGFFRAWTNNDGDLFQLSVLLLCGAFILSMSHAWMLDVGRTNGILKSFLLIAIVVEAVQVVLFRVSGRLPALAYEGSVSVRFGSILDDPNTWGILTALLLPIAWLNYRNNRIWRLLIVGVLLSMLILTQSITGIIATVVAVGVLLTARDALGRFESPFFVISLVGLAALVANRIGLTSIVNQVLETKQGSIEQHLDSTTGLMEVGVADLIGVGQDTRFWESSYVALLYSAGLVFTVAYVGLGVWSCVQLRRHALSSSAGAAVYWGFFAYQVAFMVGSVNMRFFDSFPANFLFILGICLSGFEECGMRDLSLDDYSDSHPKSRRVGFRM